MLTAGQRELIDGARRGVLATTAADGRARLVPIAYAVVTGRSQELVLYSALDEKPKSVGDPRALARVRDILSRPRVSVLVDRWSEDWAELGWIRLDGNASLIEPGGSQAAEHERAVGLLRARYPQYAMHRLEQRPILRITVDHVVGWGADS